MKVNAISSSETAYLCRRCLGNERAWDDALTDMRRGKTTVCGLTLLPCGQMHDGRKLRPYYRVSDVVAFIKDCRGRLGLAEGKDQPIVESVELDITDTRPWKFIELEPVH